MFRLANHCGAPARGHGAEECHRGWLKLRRQVFLNALTLFQIVFALASSAAVIGVSGGVSRAEPRAIRFTWHWRDFERLSPPDSLRKAHLPEADKKILAEFLAQELSEPNPEFRPDSDVIGWEAAVKLVDLNGDGTPEVIAQLVAAC